MKYKNIEKIFPEIEQGQDFNEEDIQCIQIQHLMTNNIKIVVERLLKLYKESPELVVSTILVAHNSEFLQESQPFPYTLLLQAVMETSQSAECIEAVCAGDKSGTVYMNLLYRACFCKKIAQHRVLNIVEKLLNFMESRKYLRDRRIWGLSRKRVGVWDIDDQEMPDFIGNNEINIYNLGSLKVYYYEQILDKFSQFYVSKMIRGALGTPGIELEKMEEYIKLKEKCSPKLYKELLMGIFKKCEGISRFHDVIVKTSKNKAILIEEIIDIRSNFTDDIDLGIFIKFPKLWKTIGEYKLPCFLDGLLMRFTEGENIQPEINLEMVRRLAVILKQLFSDTEIKTNFCEMVLNIYNQDRSKETYDEKNNCSDIYALNSAFMLLEVTQGICNHNFEMKIGINKFASFCFFYTMRLFEISANKLIREFQQTNKETPLFKIFLSGRKQISTYLRFVLNVLNTRKGEVFMPVINEIKKLDYNKSNDILSIDKFTISSINILDNFISLLDLSFEDSKATSIGEILKDKEFITTALLIQDCISEFYINPELFLFFSLLLIFKNTFHTSIIRSIFIHKGTPLLSSHPSLLPRLVRCYTDKFGDNSQSNRFFLNKIFIGKIMPNDINSLRMVNAMVSDLDTHIRGVLDSVVKINDLCRKITIFEAMLENSTIPDDLSEDEEARYVDDSELARTLRNATDIQIRRNAEIYVRSFPNQRVEDIYNYLKSLSYRETDPPRYRLLVKININRNRLDSQEKNLKVSIRCTNSFFKVLINFTLINRKLFLNRNIFMRLCTIINGALMILLGPKRGIYRLDKSKLENIDKSNSDNSRLSETYNPRFLLVSTLQLVINLVSRNELLITRSGFSSDLLRLGLQIITEKSLLSASNISLLSDIVSVLSENRSMENVDEDIPENFIDPLTCNFMEHPVRITTSNVIMDKSTFNQIMLNDATDPFSRLPLTESSYEECPDLQQEINEYLKNKENI